MAKTVMLEGGSYNWTSHLVRDMMVKPELAGLLTTHAIRVNMTVRAALTGGQSF